VPSGMPNQKFLSHALKSQLMEILKFQYSNVLVHQSQQLASHAVQHHAMIVHVLSVQRQIVREMTVHVLMHHAAKNQHLKKLSMTSAKSQRLAQLSL
jgi:hypothetical protein